jgi:putative SOS response-associated peptidase YedK
MCARFPADFDDLRALAELFEATLDPDVAAEWRPRYNVAPSDGHVILREKQGARELVPARWGLVPPWAKDLSGGVKHINARAETVATTPVYREPFARGRCLVPTSGFYEWHGPKRARRPVWFHAPDRGVVLLAGLYASFRAPGGERLRTFSIVTTAANDTVARVHDRMPALIDPREAAGVWLHGAPDEASALLVPAPGDRLVATPVSPRLNTTDVDDRGCLEPWSEAQLWWFD